MSVIWGAWSGPKNDSVEPRQTIRLSWFYFGNTDEPPTVYWEISWKSVNTDGWDSGGVTTTTGPPDKYFYDVPPNKFALGQAYDWRVREWRMKADETGLEVASQFTATILADGYVWSQAKDSSTGIGIVPRKTYYGFPIQFDPGEYEVRVMARNGLRWSAWAGPATIRLHDTRKFVRKSGSWNAVPIKRKKSTGGFEVGQE